MISFSQNSVESILTRESLTQASALTSTQSQVDVLVSRFSEEATNWRSLAAMATGSLFYRFGRMGTLALASRASGLAPVLQAASYGVGLGTEVTAFEGTSRLLASVSGERTNPHLWDWNGRGGWREGLASSLVTFGMLKGAGSLAQGQNVVLQHLFSDLAMVGGHQVASGLGFMERPEGSIGEQLLHAEVTNLQLGLGMGLLHQFSPGLVSWERSLDLSLRARESSLRPLSNEIHLGPRHALADGPDIFSEPGEAASSPIKPHILQMSMGEGPGNGRKEADGAAGNRSRGDETVRVAISKDASTAGEASAEASSFLQFERWTESTRSHLSTVIRLRLARQSLEGLEVRFSGIDEAQQRSVRDELHQLLQNLHRERPLPENWVLKLVIPDREITWVFRSEEAQVRVTRILDQEGSLVMDDTPDPEAEAQAEQVRLSLPPQTRVATTVMQLFEALKEGLKAGDATVHFESPSGFEAKAPDVARWLGMGKDQLSEGGMATVMVPRENQRYVFSRQGDSVSFRKERISSVPPSAPLPSDPLRESEKPTLPPERPVAPASPVPPPKTAPVAVRAPIFVEPSFIMLLSRASRWAEEASEAPLEVFYTGDRMPGEGDFERLQSSLSNLSEGQNVRIYLTQFQQSRQITRQNGKLVSSDLPWPEAPTFANLSVRHWGELAQNLSHFLFPHREARSQNPVITYLGGDWNDRAALETLADFLSDHMIGDGQTLTFKVGREDRLVIQRINDRLTARLSPTHEASQDFVLLPDPLTHRWVVREGGKLPSFDYVDLREYHRAAAELARGAMSRREIGEVAGARLSTGLPLETVIQSPAVRGRLFAEIAHAALKNQELPNFFQQWEEVHRFVQQAYVRLDFETVQHYQKHLKETELYAQALQTHNNRAGATDPFIPLEEMTLDLPAASLIPKTEILRDGLTRQMVDVNSPDQVQVVLRDPRSMGGCYKSLINNLIGVILSNREFLEKTGEGRDLGVLLDPETSLSGELADARRDLLSALDSLPEIGRLLTNGRGIFYETFLKNLLYESPLPVRESYARGYELVSKLPIALRKRWDLERFPSLEEIEAQVPEGRRTP